MFLTENTDSSSFSQRKNANRLNVVLCWLLLLALFTNTSWAERNGSFCNQSLPIALNSTQDLITSKNTRHSFQTDVPAEGLLILRTLELGPSMLDVFMDSFIPRIEIDP